MSDIFWHIYIVLRYIMAADMTHASLSVEEAERAVTL
jgi:hypothetical protein